MKKLENAFLDVFQPYRGKFRIKTYKKSIGDYEWSERQQFLTESLIRRAIQQKVQIAFFNQYTTDYIAIDIDDHQEQGESYLLKIYNQVVSRIKYLPSIIYKSPRGLHVYYFFKERIPIQIISDEMGKKLSGLEIEIKPTDTSALRIPGKGTAIDPDTMQLIRLPFSSAISKVKRYNYSKILETPSFNIVDNLETRRTSVKMLKSSKKIEQVENSILPFIDGATNDVFLKLCQVYRCSGFTQEQAFERFQQALKQSPTYRGDLHNQKRLKQRIKSEYKNNAYIPERKTKKPIDDINPIYETIAENIVNLPSFPFANQRKKPTKKFIVNLLGWKEKQNEIFKDRKELGLKDFYYPYYMNNRKKGLYPLPQVLLKNWNKRYNEIMSFLKEINFLKESGHKYSKQLNICKYYYINDPDLIE